VEVEEQDENRAERSARRRSQGRQQRAEGGRRNRVDVKLTDEEMVQVKARAISLGVSAPRLLVETALYGGVATVSERHQLYRELAAVRRLVAALGNNVNQLARIANSTGHLEPETGAAMDATRRAVTRLDDLLATMTAPPDRSMPWNEEGDEDDR
jgi:hypothetical protein